MRASSNKQSAALEKAALSKKKARRSPDKKDREIAEEILRIHSKLKKVFMADGEWKWINENKKKNYIKALRDNNPDALAAILANLFQEDASYGFYTYETDSLQAGIRADLAVWNEFVEQNDISPLSMPDVGNPHGIVVGGVLVAPFQPRHDYCAQKIHSLGPKTVLEIGGGYGGLALQLSRRSNVKYIDCDLPETLYVAYYFLKKAGLNVKWAIDTWPDAPIVLVPANRKKLIQKADLVFNGLSFSEMGRETVDGYFKFINNVWKPRYIFHQNSNILLFPNSPRHIEVLARDFPIGKIYREIYRAISPWQGGSGRYREYLYERNLER
ncbi:MAG: hypothetical protein G01um10148_301 [Parcubacteria group bacterium Gr01-1014_8]|nr:MAG: hypothetical protein G01um10148_301 [Parcubacteria group bacterium Gr01-1014_8]